MDRYQKVEKPRPESAINENEIRITAQGLIRNYVSYATSLLQDKRVREIVLKAMGQAISKTVAIAEIIKKRIPGLHQVTSISSVSITDVWEPIEEGLVPLETTRHVSMISISLSPRELNKNSPGYPSDSKSSNSNSNINNINHDKVKVNLVKIHMDGAVVEEEAEEGDGVEEDMVGMVDMGTIKGDMGTIKGDMGTIKGDMGTIKVAMGTIKVAMVDMATMKVDTADMATVKVDMEDMETTEKMVDGTRTGLEVVGEAEGTGAMADMNVAEVVGGRGAEATGVGGDVWVAVGGGTETLV
ncbi:Ribonuclease P protein subunit p25-like protein [Ananas comosus]|uniref:Ribonuclease P protein subunit p25-like protein n=1 Tax=Ananas comosus TaxID=4615 RepID=A0A199VV24_ANACO|nr:Ribonuclease P protein subunit p25-like protein [Ananas comosus]